MVFFRNTDTILQSQVDETDSNGWISGIYINLHGEKAPKADPTFSGTVTFPDASTITDYLKITPAAETYATIEDPTFTGTVTFPVEAISQSAIYWAEENGWFTTTFEAFNAEQVYLDANKADRLNPTFEGTVTFIDTSTTPNTSTTISDYLKSSTAASTYLSQSSAASTYLTTSNAASTYLTTSSAASTYAPKASPTFTGTISLNGDVTLASASTNTLTLNDHLVLVTGTNFTTPISGQQGYIITGTNATDSTAITSGSNLTYSTIDLSYGVWMVFGQIGFQNLTGGTQATITVKKLWYS